MAIGHGVCLGRSAGQVLAAGANEDEIADVLLAIARWLGSAGSSLPLPMWRPRSGNDVAAALGEPDGY